MKIIIPMSGSGSRFVKAGYKDIKPLIEVDGKTIIEHVIDIFPGEEDFIFICNREHLRTSNIAQVLKKIKQKGQIVAIEPHHLGPVYAVSQIFHLIDDEEPVIVNYVDFSVYWNYKNFKDTVALNKCDGCITAYRGFHPHLAREGLYAGIMTDQHNNMLQIQEKHSFTENKMDSFHSAGTYYFRKGSYIKKYFKKLMDENIHTNGEYYVSMAYQLMNDECLSIYIYEVEYFLQWGTPQDLEEYKYWSDLFSLQFKKGLVFNG